MSPDEIAGLVFFAVVCLPAFYWWVQDQRAKDMARRLDNHNRKEES